jgi:hypothetical protein
MAVKNTLGKVSNMGEGAVKYAIGKCVKNNNTGSKYYASLLDRLAEIGGRR